MTIMEGKRQQAGRFGAGAVAESLHLIHKHEGEGCVEGANCEWYEVFESSKPVPSDSDTSPPTKPMGTIHIQTTTGSQERQKIWVV